jgi:putative NADH-flavin reductase
MFVQTNNKTSISMSIIAVFGATGRTGKPFVEKALAAGHTVRALARNPAKLTIRHPGLTVMQGDATNAADVQKTIAGTDAVVSLLGQDKNSPVRLQTDATRLIIAAMKRAGIRRLISLTGGGVRNPGADQPKFMDNLIVFIMKNIAGSGPKNALEDGIAHANLIRASGLDWTIVRGPMLTDDAEKGTYQVGNVGTVPGIKLTRADLADFILKEVEQKKYVGQMPFVTNG